jgi:hypothetical protein
MRDDATRLLELAVAGLTNGADNAGALFVCQRRTSIKSKDVSYVTMRSARGFERQAPRNCA